MPKHLIVEGKPVKVTAEEALKLVAAKGAKYISKNEYKRACATAEKSQ